MTWDELRSFLVIEDERTRAGAAARLDASEISPETSSDRRARRLAGEYAARSAIDEACRHFAAHAIWPALDVDATLYAHDRWIWAFSFFEWLDETAPSRAEHTQREWLEWLLIESWHELGSSRWRESQRPRP